jgi:hypothetical protein
MALATMVLLMLAVVPHHHHQGLWCNVAEMCSVDKDVNDEHTHHHDDSSSCVEHLNYVATKYSATQANVQLLQYQFVAILSFCCDSLFTQSNNESSHLYGPQFVFTGIDAHKSHSLRAPPVA